MNKIYKVIWSKVKNCYVVVSEIARNHGKEHSSRKNIPGGVYSLALALGLAFSSVPLVSAAAANTGNASANQAVNIEDKTETTAQGSDAYATYDSQGNLIVGKDNQVSPIQKDPKTGNARVDSKPENVVLGTRNGVGKFTHSTETKKPISGDASYAYEKLDTEWITVKVYNPDTNSYDDKQVEVYKLTPGQYMDDAYNVRAKYPERSYYSTDEDYRKAVEVYNNVATYYSQDRTRQSYYTSGATAVGVDNVAEGDHSTAVGNKAKVLNSVSSYYVDAYGKLTSNQADARFWLDEQGNITNSRQGYYASDGTFVDRYYMVPRLIDSSDAVAIGSDVTAEGRSAVAMGHQSYAKEYSVAIGENSVTDYMGVAIGKDNKAKYASTAIGHTNDANGYYTAALGVKNTARADESTAIGYGNSVDGQQQNGGTTPKAYFTHVLGSNNTVKGSYNAVFGDTNTVTGAYALALGGRNTISGANTNDGDGEYGIAIGYGNNVEKNGLALGLNSNAIHDGSIAIGKSVNTTGDNNNGATDSIAIGTKASVHMKNGVVLGNEAYAGNNGDDSEGAISIGHQARSAAGGSIAIGAKATTGNNVGSTGMTNIGAIAIGSNSTADTVYDIAMGWGANTKNTANGGAIALGHNATIEAGGQASVAIGDSARVTGNLHDAVALGSQSYAERTANNQGGYDPASNSQNHNAGSDPVWNSTLAAVSVGSSTRWDGTKNVSQQTRQITNVAAGKEDTDAVNVAQLKQVVSLVNNGGGSGTGGSGVHDYSVNSVDPANDTNYNNTGATGNNALAAGVSASATGAHSVAVGNGAQATGQDSIALGTNAKAEGNGAAAIGQYNTASGQNSLAFGGGYNKDQKGNTASGVASVAFGEGTQAISEGTLAFGENTQAGSTEKDKKGNPLGQNAVAFGNGTKATGGRSLAFGERTVASANDATAFGNESVASGTGATAFGNKNQATGLYATAWGGGDKQVDNGDGTTKKVGTVASGTYATAFGERTVASGESATAFGSDSTASGKNAAAFGASSTAVGENSLAALGGTVDEKATNAAAIGNGAQAKLADAVALGSGSVADRQSGVKGYDAATGAETTQTSAAWVSNANAIAVGNGSTLTRQITGVAAGSQDTDAVNLAQLKEVGKLAGKHTTVSVGGQKADADDALVKGGNLELKRQTTGGQANYDVALSKDVVLGEQEEHKGGSLVVNSVAQFRTAPGSKETYPVKEAVKIDGTTVSVVKNDGTNDQRQVVLGIGQDIGGYVALYDNTGKTPTYIFNAISSGITYLKDSKTYPADEANEFKRLEYGDITNGSTQFIATLDDGLKFSGDQGTASAVKLNQKLSVTGGETNPDNLATANNIGVVSSQDGENGKLELKLNKNLTGLNTVTAGTAKIGHHADGVLDTVQNGQPTGGHAKGGEFVIGLTNTEWTVDAPTYVSGRAATEDELRTVSDAVSGNTTKITNNTTQITNNANTIAKGLSFTTNTKDAANTTEGYKGYKVVKRSLGDTIAIKASDEADGHSYSKANLTTRIAENGDISILMDEKPTFTTVTTGDVIYTGNPDKKDNDGKAAQADTSVHYGDKTLTDGKNITTSDNETKSTRLGYQDAQGIRYDLATLDDGQIYAGDVTSDGKQDEKGFARTLNQKTTINGGVKETGKLTDNNIGVVSNGTDTLTVKLAKELKDLTSVTTGKTVQNDSGITITNDSNDETKNVIINGDKISFGGNQVTNMGSGIDTATNKYDITTNGANIGDVQNIANTTVQPVIDTVNKGWELEVDGIKRKDVTPTSRVVNLAAGQNIELGGTGDTVTIATADDVRFNTVRAGGDADGKGGYTGGIVIGKQSGKNADGTLSANPDENYYITGLQNTNWDADKIMKGRAATEDQLQAVADEIKNGTVKGDVFVTGGSVKYKGEGTEIDDGTGKLYLTEQNKTDPLEITGLHDYYATGGSVTADGKTLEITRNDRDEQGNPKKISIDLSNVMKNDLRLVKNPDAADGKYTVAQDGTVTLKVQNADGTVSRDITIGGFEGVAKGLNFDANTRTTADGKAHNVKMGSTIKVQGTDPVDGHSYSADNVTTEVDDSGNITIKLDKDLTANTVTVGQAGKEGEKGAAGSISINGKDGKDGITTTLIRTEKGQPGKDGTNGKPGVDGTDITRIVYQNGQDGTDGKDLHTVAILEDGLKFAGDDGQTDTTKVISKKLNEQLDIIGGADLDSLTDNNIGVKNKDGKLYVRLAKHVDLDEDGTLKAGDATFGAFSNTELTTNKNNHPSAGSYATGLSNKDWSVADPEYVSGRAATEDQLAKLSQTITDSNTVRTDYQLVQNPNTDDGSYTATNGELTLTVRDTEHTNDPKYPDKTITLKDIASKTKVDEAYDRTVKYDMKDGKVDKTHVTFEAADEAGNPVDTQVRHMASGASEITDDGKGNKTYTYNTDNNAANIGDVKRLAAEADLHYSGDTGTGTSLLKEAVAFNGTQGQIVTAAENGKVTFKLADDLTTQTITVTGKDGKDGQPGTPGRIGIDGKDGKSSIGLDGKDGISIKGENGTIGLSGKDGISVKGKDGKDGVTITGKDGVDGVDGAEGHIGLNGKDGMVDIWTKPGRPGVDGKDGETLTRIVYQGTDGKEHQGATLDDGLKFHGDSGDVVTRKLNTQLDVLGGQTDTAKLTDGNIGVVSTKAADENSNGKLEIRLAKELKDLTSVQTGDTTVDGDGLKIEKAGKDGKGTITINKTTVSMAGNQITNMGSGLGNTYTAAEDNNGANIGDVKKIADGRRTTVKSTDGSVSVVDKNASDSNAPSHEYDLSVDTSKVAGTMDLKYKGDNNTEGSNKLSEAVTFSGTEGQIVTQAENGKVTFRLADDVTTQTITANGKNGNDGQIGLTGKDGADGSVTTIIKTVGAKGTDGKDGIPGVDGQPGKDGITRLMYEEKGGTEHHVVATLDDGLKFVGNDGNVVARRLNDTLSIKGGIDDAEMLADKSRVSIRNLGVRQNTAKDGLEIVMTNRPDFEAITVGPDSSSAHKITIGQQDNKDGNPNPAKGNYIKGLDNTQWDAGNVVADRAATEGQLSQAITDISGKDKGGFGLADEAGNTVKKDLGQTVTVKGDGKNIETKVNGDALEVSLKKDVDLGKEGSIKAGNTTINSDGVETNKVKVGDITITDQGINGGAKQITNIASGLDSTKHYNDPVDNNAASIGDVKQIAGDEAGKAAEAVKSKSGKNITVKDDHTVNLNDNITLGDETDASKQVAIDGNGAKITAGDGANQVTVDGAKGQVTIGSGDNAMTLGKQANTAGDSNPANGNFLNGLENTKWDGKNIQSGRAATEDQLKTVSDKVSSGRKFQGDDGQEVKVGLGETLNLKGGAKEISSADNVGIVKGDDNTLNVRLAKDITGLNSVTTGNTTINNSGLTVKTGDSNRNITVQDGKVDMGGNQIHNVAPGTAPTDAVNVSQLQQTGRAINQLGSSLDKLGSRVDRVGANSAALAALHPLDFDPDDKLDFAVGAGNYSGANAVALGAFYRPNEDVMFSIGGSTGGGENMVNVGATFKIGQHNHVSNSRVAMAKEIRDLKALVARQDGEMQQLKTLMNQLAGKTVMAVDKDALFPDIPENHWAYDYVMKLARAGIIEGYEDGEFKGDRMMTRYEFAALLYRAIMAGAASNPDLNQDGTLGRLVKEFDGELKYIRIDVIEKDKHGNPTIERVRTVEDSKKHHGK
ncbi:ESPR-type extended signal peptide-containing protein [Acidaminococcus massiliensis]|uniref:ESPR-type extended signal peptide-containing protein n=2 Tax=Acidaminococcus massiliensis TaxID=1852375 RepID=UPI0026DC48AD|nr:ESPR-type extended signal peptide-containing protein [Acidaminococcus massiliensis]